MSNGDGLLNKQQRKKARRKTQKHNEREAHRNLDTVTAAAVEQALQLAPTCVDTRRPQVLHVDLASKSEAEFVRKRVNDALNVAEWLSEVSVVLSESSASSGATSAVGDRALELRIERTHAD